MPTEALRGSRGSTIVPRHRSASVSSATCSNCVFCSLSAPAREREAHTRQLPINGPAMESKGTGLVDSTTGLRN